MSSKAKTHLRTMLKSFPKKDGQNIVPLKLLIDRMWSDFEIFPRDAESSGAFIECRHLPEYLDSEEKSKDNAPRGASFSIKIKHGFFRNKEVAVLIFNDTSVQD